MMGSLHCSACGSPSLISHCPQSAMSLPEPSSRARSGRSSSEMEVSRSRCGTGERATASASAGESTGQAYERSRSRLRPRAISAVKGEGRASKYLRGHVLHISPYLPVSPLSRRLEVLTRVGRAPHALLEGDGQRDEVPEAGEGKALVCRGAERWSRLLSALLSALSDGCYPLRPSPSSLSAPPLGIASSSRRTRSGRAPPTAETRASPGCGSRGARLTTPVPRSSTDSTPGWSGRLAAARGRRQAACAAAARPPTAY